LPTILGDELLIILVFYQRIVEGVYRINSNKALVYILLLSLLL
jgi:hypothetical protein